MNVRIESGQFQWLLRKVSKQTDCLVCKQNRLPDLNLVLSVQTSPQPEMTND